MLKELEDNYWDSAFWAAFEEADGPMEAVPPGASVSVEPFGTGDVAHIERMRVGEHDAYNWVMYGRLHDDRWFYISAEA